MTSFIVAGFHHPDVPLWQKILLRGLYPLIRAYLLWVLDIRPESAKAGLLKAREIIKEVEAHLAKAKYIMNTESPR